MVNLSTDSDIFVWKLTPSGTFTVKSMCADMMNGPTILLRKYIWKLKVRLNKDLFLVV